jgi:hypothetical protein
MQGVLRANQKTFRAIQGEFRANLEQTWEFKSKFGANLGTLRASQGTFRAIQGTNRANIEQRRKHFEQIESKPGNI